MLSKVEQQFIKSPDAFSPDYQRILRYRIRHKVQRLKALLPLLEANGYSVMDNRNSVTEFSNGEQSINQGSFNKSMVLRAGFGPASSARKAGILNRAIFGRAIFLGSSTGAPFFRSIMQNMPSFE